MGVCQRPSLSIRRARIQRASLDMLVENGSMHAELAGFLSAAVAARKNIMIAGATNAGKTTLLRALANEIPPAERLITVERALELGLGEFEDLHPNVVAFEERLPNSEGQGAIHLSELVRRSLRMNPSRVIVGEVLGDEIVTMLNAMSQGNDGSLSTIHANSSLEVFNRICTYAIQSAERLPSDATMMLIAGAIDFVIFVERRNEYATGGGLRRLVTSVREVNGVDGRVLSSEIFAEGQDGTAVPAAPIQCMDELLAAGYQPTTTQASDEHPNKPLAALAPRRGPRMTPDQLLIVLLGAVIGGGIALLLHSLRGVEGVPNAPVRPSSLLPTLKRLGARLPLAVVAGLVILLLTRWVVLAGATGLLVFFAPALFGGARSERVAIARLEGLAAWTESLRDTIAGAVGLEQAIPATATAAAPAIRDELIALSDRLRVRTPLPVALQLFADDLDDSSADLIVAALMLNSQLRGPGLRDVLSSLAHSARDELEMRRRVNAGRASTRRSVQIVMGITVTFVLGLTLFNREYVEPYSGAVGQIVLLVILGLFAAGFAWMRRLAAFEVPERFLFSAGYTGRGTR